MSTSLFYRLRRRLGAHQPARTFRRWRTRDRAWVGRLVSRLGTVSLEGARFRVDSPLISDELKCRLFYGRYERTERELLRRHLDSSLPVIELGGGMGVVACIINRRLQDRTRHVVVEANARILPLLAANRTLNHAGFEVVHGAIAYAGPVAGVEAGLDLLSTTTSDASRVEPVPAVTFQQIVASRGFSRCALVCDIEGAEVELVEREIDSLQRNAAMIIIEEHPEQTPPEVREAMFSRLAEAGFARVETLRKVSMLVNTRVASMSPRVEKRRC